MAIIEASGKKELGRLESMLPSYSIVYIVQSRETLVVHAAFSNLRDAKKYTNYNDRYKIFPLNVTRYFH